MNTIKLLKTYYIGLTKAKLEYRFTFFIQFFITIFGVAVGYLGIWVLLDKFHEIEGWNLYEMLLLYASGYFCYAVSDVVFGVPMKWLGRWAKLGEFDSILIRPIDPLLHVLLKQFSFKFGPVVISILALAVCFVGLNRLYDPILLLMYPISLLGGVMIESALMVIVGSLGLRLFETKSAAKMLTKELREFTNYPLEIFPASIVFILLTIVPLAFVNYVPVRCLLGKDGGSGIIMLVPLVIGMIGFFVAYKFFRWNITKYSSTGS